MNTLIKIKFTLLSVLFLPIYWFIGLLLTAEEWFTLGGSYEQNQSSFSTVALIIVLTITGVLIGIAADFISHYAQLSKLPKKNEEKLILFNKIIALATVFAAVAFIAIILLLFF